jgi:7-carboxy-7-deazaguanine synthase
MKQHTYSEIFYSIQGEGEYTGVPTAWLRFFLCNLQCNGFGQKNPTDESTYVLPYKDFDPKSVNRIEDLPVWTRGCDSSYSWSSKFKHLQYRKTAKEICDQIQAELTNEWNPTGTFLHPLSHVEQHMCFTGGEPLMKHGQQAVVEIIEEFKTRDGGKLRSGFAKGSNQPEFITFETNGTQELDDDFVKFFANKGLYNGELFFSVSPKLWTVAGERPEKAIKPDNVAYYNWLSNGRGQLKFVVGADKEQWDEVDEVVAKFREAGVTYPVWIMPVGATEEAQTGEMEGYASAGQIAEMAYKRGYSVSARVHVYLWGNLIGV